MKNLIVPILHNTMLFDLFDDINNKCGYSVFYVEGEIDENHIYVRDLLMIADELDWMFVLDRNVKDIITCEIRC